MLHKPWCSHSELTTTAAERDRWPCICDPSPYVAKGFGEARLLHEGHNDPLRPPPAVLEALAGPMGRTDLVNQANEEMTEEIRRGRYYQPGEIEAIQRSAKLAEEALAKHPHHALPSDAAERKAVPVATGFIDYFPLAIAAVARLSQIGNDQHNPGTPLHWDRSKSGDEGDALMRHFLERGTVDTDGVRHSAKMAWRAMALLQKELEDVGD